LYNPVWQQVERTMTVRSTRFSNRVVQPVERTVAVRSTRLSNRFDKRFGNRLDVCLHDTAGCSNFEQLSERPLETTSYKVILENDRLNRCTCFCVWLDLLLLIWHVNGAT